MTDRVAAVVKEYLELHPASSVFEISRATKIMAGRVAGACLTLERDGVLTRERICRDNRWLHVYMVVRKVDDDGDSRLP